MAAYKWREGKEDDRGVFVVGVLARGPEMWKEAGRERELRARIGRRKDKGVEKKWEVFFEKGEG